MTLGVDRMFDSRDAVAKKVIEIIAEQLVDVKPSEISEQSSFEEDLRANSLDLAELIMKIEEVFSLGDIKEEDADKIKSVGDIIDYVADKLGFLNGRSLRPLLLDFYVDLSYIFLNFLKERKNAI
jgi:acyl carrier protein